MSNSNTRSISTNPSLEYEDSCITWPYPSETLCEIPHSHTFDNKLGLSQDLAFLSTMKDFCDMTFIVGSEQHPVYAVSAILAARSRVMKGIITLAHNSSLDKNKSKRKISLSLKGKSKKSLSCQNLSNITIPMPDFDPVSFSELIQYLHTGKSVLQASTVIGLLNAADNFCVEELKRACIGYIERCLEVDTVFILLETAAHYFSYKYTRIALKKILDFIDANAEEILNHPEFENLTEDVATLILGREMLQTSAFVKFRAAYAWCVEHMHDSMHQSKSIDEMFSPFITYIKLHEISAIQLMNIVKPSGAVKHELILDALAFQADPNSVDVRRLDMKQRSFTVAEAFSTPSGTVQADTTCTLLPSMPNSLPNRVTRNYLSIDSPVKHNKILPTTPEEPLLTAHNNVKSSPELLCKPAQTLIDEDENDANYNKNTNNNNDNSSSSSSSSSSNSISRLDGSNVHINQLKFNANKTVSETALHRNPDQYSIRDSESNECSNAHSRNSSQLSSTPENVNVDMEILNSFIINQHEAFPEIGNVFSKEEFISDKELITAHQSVSYVNRPICVKEDFSTSPTIDKCQKFANKTEEAIGRFIEGRGFENIVSYLDEKDFTLNSVDIGTAFTEKRIQDKHSNTESKSASEASLKIQLDEKLQITAQQSPQSHSSCNTSSAYYFDCENIAIVNNSNNNNNNNNHNNNNNRNRSDDNRADVSDLWPSFGNHKLQKLENLFEHSDITITSANYSEETDVHIH